jgi:hypothetical protein
MPYVQKPQPLIAAQIEYTLAPAPPLPSITPHIEFTAERLAYCQVEVRRDIIDLSNIGPSDESTAESSTRVGLRSASKTKIPKPTGESGRPGSGGFCVEDSLVKTHGWTEDSVKKLIVCSMKLLSNSNCIDNADE